MRRRLFWQEYGDCGVVERCVDVCGRIMVEDEGFVHQFGCKRSSSDSSDSSFERFQSQSKEMQSKVCSLFGRDRCVNRWGKEYRSRGRCGVR